MKTDEVAGKPFVQIIPGTLLSLTLIESSLDQELSVVRSGFGLSNGEPPNYISLIERLLTSGFLAILSSVY